MQQTELYHYGVKGMKWGVRRYQNPDGTLTSAGRKKARELYKQHHIERPDNTEYLKEHGIHRNVSSGTDVIKKGTTLERLANSGERLDSKRKYVSVTEADKQKYYEAAMEGQLWCHKNKDVSLYELTLNKDVKVASGKKVVNDILNKYGNNNIKTTYNDYKTLMDLTGSQVSENAWVTSARRVSGKKVQDFMKDVMKKNMDEITKHYEKQGYDAIVDPEDFVNYYTDYPVVLLNPKKSVKSMKEVRKVTVDY